MIHFDFHDRTAIVTGGTRGIGAAVTAALLAAGARVIAVYAGNHDAAKAFQEQCQAGDGQLELACFNVANYQAAEAFFRRLDDQNRQIDILVNSAGIRRDAIVAMMPEQDWRQVLDVNLTGAFIMAKLAVMRMSRKRYGRIINITSPSGRIGFEGQANYAASKAGQVAFTKSLAKEVARRNITVNCISPGFIDTDFISALPEEQLAAYREMIPKKRFGKAEEVAQAILFLATEEADYITGAVLEISGGLS
ncbi:MAG TPA: 3-oxoacyl-ACP reductase FabG [Lentisphaeria bacterium]|nr:MAG: 3-oxoacyl-(acyl-carrier-protein) reductase FabG [Lentisphaerae bacterium ADurb.Bin082]HPY91184.1 3-oxoacyl-ACP reductase FabG [Lentisphaeria bacterium]HQC53259.1 3-oxoacyl-ACP reductase FabG [Lentisphaeria bacterium]HQL87918.1 3-oxoacyl-ACP reductase FabG [Lentisphaeria bacterium]